MSEPTAPLLQATIARKQYGPSALLEHIRLALPSRCIQVILGPSGCGKTTLLKMIAGLDRQFDGLITLEGEPLKAPSRQVALMFQDVRLLPWKTVRRNLEFVGTATARCGELLRSVGLDPEVTRLYPRQLSGGMAKRVALARALSSQPKILLLDEPFSDLDHQSKFILYDLLNTLVKTQAEPLAVLMVTHDIDEAVYLADEVLVLSKRRPTTINARFTVDLPRPRQENHPEFLRLCTAIVTAAISDGDVD